MENLTEDKLKPAFYGQYDDQIVEIISVIDGYLRYPDFLSWLSDGNFQHRLLAEEIEKNRYFRIVQCHIEGYLVFTAKVDFHVDKFPKSAVDFLTKERRPLYYNNPAFITADKAPVSKIVSPPYFTVISYVVNHGDVGGMAWEIYELPTLLDFYNKKKILFDTGEVFIRESLLILLPINNH
ncbi:MAG TPA: hypothetical protein PKW79_00750 [Rhabdochlamydiaceae bacterium]|nr:hypothetical protein [Rhabdochlamydiaceae bacterium]